MDFENDTDFEMHDLERVGNTAHNLKKKGICSHGWRQGDFHDLNVLCLDCGKVATWDELDEDFQKYL